VGAPEIVLVRHGETEWSRDHRHTGRTDVPLTENGREQASALMAQLAGRSFRHAYVSPLKRARETCELAGLGEHAEIRPELVELDYGDAEGITTEQMRERIPGWSIWTHETLGAERLADAAKRLEPILAELRNADADIAVVAHGHILRILSALWIGMPPEGGSRLALATGRICILGWERENQVIRGWNC
jgi:broad specificity phosphatase PhoE